jgi:hypothetical protein
VTKLASIPHFHLHKALEAVSVEFWRQHFLQERHKLVAQERASRHPLEIVSLAMEIWPIQLPSGKRAVDPVKDCLVPHMHAERDMGLLSVAPESALANQQANENALIEIAGGRGFKVQGSRSRFKVQGQGSKFKVRGSRFNFKVQGSKPLEPKY